MATGFTYRILEGCSFEEFVWAVARSMGALIMMRDEPADAPIPEKFKPQTDHHEHRIRTAKQDLSLYEKLADEEIASMAHADLEEARRNREELITKKTQERELYEAMRKKVMAWEPPSQDHAGLKRYMLEQIDQSIYFDCYDIDPIDESQYDLANYRKRKIKGAKRDIEYYEKQMCEEIERTQERNQWLAQLRESVPTPTKENTDNDRR